MLGLMSHSERQRPRRADVAKFHDGAGYISTVVTNRRRGVFYRHFSAIAPDQHGMIRQTDHQPFA